MVRGPVRGYRAGWRSCDLLELRRAAGVELEERELTGPRDEHGLSRETQPQRLRLVTELWQGADRFA